jgi:YVTN family beta-propeller protein
MKLTTGPAPRRTRSRARVTMLRLVVVVAALLMLAPTPALSAPPFTVVKTIDVDISPFGITASPDGQTMWVANSGGVEFLGGTPSNKISIIDIATLSEEPDKITVGSFPEHIAFTKDGSHAAVTNGNDATVSIIDTASRTATQTVSIAPVGLAYPFGVIFNKTERQAFVTTGGGFDNAIAVLDTRDIDHVRLAGTVSASGYPGLPVLNPINGQLLVPSSLAEIGTAQLLVVNPNSGHIIHDFRMPIDNAFANDIAVSPDGRFAYISIFAFSGGSGGVWVVDLKRQRTVTVIDTGDPSVYGMGITPDGRFVFATNFTNNQVAVIDAHTNGVIATVPVGARPNQIAVTHNGTEAFVTNQSDTTVSVISIPHDEE